MAADLKDALDVRVIGHLTGIDEVERALHNIGLQLKILEAALANLEVELEVE